MIQEDWFRRAEARVMALRVISRNMASLCVDDRRTVLLDVLLEFDPELFEALSASVRMRQAPENTSTAGTQSCPAGGDSGYQIDSVAELDLKTQSE